MTLQPAVSPSALHTHPNDTVSARRLHTRDSRGVKRKLRARKRSILAEKRAERIASTMDSNQLTEALRDRDMGTEEFKELDDLRRVFVGTLQPEMRVRLHASSRYVLYVAFVFVKRNERRFKMPVQGQRDVI